MTPSQRLPALWTHPDRGAGRVDSTLQVQDLSVTFTGGRGTISAADRVSFALQPGRVLAVVGESGCGKSATAMAILGLLPDSALVTGSARLGERELVGMNDAAMREIRGRELTAVFQEPMTSLNPVMRVGSQVSEVLRRHTEIGKRAAREHVVDLFTQVGIPEPQRRVREYPHQLSGGMRQRVMIAMAIACSPKVIIADEPTTALDVTVQATILQILRRLTAESNTAVLLITHNLGVVADIADDVAVMYAGRIVEHAPVIDLFARPAHPYTRALLAATPIPGGTNAGRLAEIPGLVPSLQVPAQFCAFHERCPRRISTCQDTRPELEAQTVPRHLLSCFNPGSEATIR